MRRVMVLIGSALLVGLPATVFACLWDRDTPYHEAMDMPEVVAALTGRFPRNPPLYYQMRLDRIEAELQGKPDDLAAYDDAGVACDRLGLGDEAIAWMEKKRDRLDALGSSRAETREHLYRYHANLGTFLIHRWIRRGADRGRIDEAEAARDEIVEALEINPNAHFGREKYQLRAIEWMIAPPQSAGAQCLPNFLGLTPPMETTLIDPKEADEMVRGLSGLIVLGNAWESVDVFNALCLALQHDTLGFEDDYGGGRNSLATFAWLRCKELIEAGKGSLLPDAPKGDELMSMIPRPMMRWSKDLLAPAFQKARAEADAWQAARTDFMTDRMAEGLHPDVDEDFWDGYKESGPPPLPMASPRKTHEVADLWRPGKVRLFLGGAGLAVLAYVAGLIRLRISRGRREAREAEAA
jgi:hypothetical protein